MGRRTFFRPNRIALTVLLCGLAIAGVFFYLQVSRTELNSKTDLFTLVPQDAIGILEAGNINQCLYDIQTTGYYEASQQLHFSSILELLSQQINDIAGKKAHGLSAPMSNILISFHKPGLIHDQVLYGHFGYGDQSMMEHILQELTPTHVSPKKEKYKGKTITIYPISNTDYLSCFFQANCYAISFQQKLIKQVIDAYQDRSSMHEDSLFASIYKQKKNENGVRLYTRNRPFAEWTSYDMSFYRNSVYLTGYSFGTMHNNTFVNSIINDTKKTLIAPAILPDHTTTFIQMGLNNIPGLADEFIHTDSLRVQYSAPDDTHVTTDLYNFLDNYSQNEIDYIEFLENDSATHHRILLLPMKFNRQTTLSAWTKFCRPTGESGWQGKYRYAIYELDNHRLMQYLLFNKTTAPKGLFAALKDNYVIISDEAAHIKAYLSSTTHALQEAAYTSELAEQANFTLFTDLEEAYQQPDKFTELLPPFLLQYLDHFRQYTLTMQYINSTDPLNTNIILNFKGE